MEQGYLSNKQKLDQGGKMEITQMLQAAKKAQQDRENAAKNKNAMWAAGGTIVGAGLGAVAAVYTGGAINPATGAMIGASVGGGLGQAAAGTQGS
jgi:hypothetical protein